MFLAVNLSIFKTSSLVNISFLKWFILQLFWAILQGSEAGAFFVSGDVEWSVSVSVIFADDTTSFTSQVSMELIKTGIDYILNRAELMV